LETIPVNAQQAAQALDRTIQSLRSLQQQIAQSGSQQGSASGAQITVQQQPADVQVTQPQPNITVTQPQVQVTQPRPEVTVQTPQPQVSVQQAQPNVEVQRQGQPQVTVQRQGEPKVTVQQQTDPNVVTKQRDAQQSGSTMAQQNQTAQTTTPGATASNEIVALGRGIVGRTVYGARGNTIAEVQDVVMGPGNEVQSVLIDVGGFLGLGEKRVALSIDQLQMQGDRLITQLTEEQAEALPRHQATR
jgi:outer membrane biosynthesis protein TonB